MGISFLAILFFAIGLLTMETKDHIINQRFAVNMIWVLYGKLHTSCTVSFLKIS